MGRELEVDVIDLPVVEEMRNTSDPQMEGVAAGGVIAEQFDRQLANVAPCEPGGNSIWREACSEVPMPLEEELLALPGAEWCAMPGPAILCVLDLGKGPELEEFTAMRFMDAMNIERQSAF